MSRETVTAEKTGKGLKLATALCVLAEIAALVVIFFVGFNRPTPEVFVGGIALFVVALVVHVIVKLLIWWKHG